MILRLALYLLLLAESACAPVPSPAATAAPHGAQAVTVESLIDAATTNVCPERVPAQPNCRVPR